MSGLDTPLTPLRFLERASEVYPTKTAVIDGSRTLDYTQFAAAAQDLALALRASGINDGQRVAFLASNSAEMLLAHYAVPLAGGVLVAINTRLAPPEVEYICNHSRAELLFGDTELLSALAGKVDLGSVREWIELPTQTGTYSEFPGTTRYADFANRTDGGYIPWTVDDEDRTISINYTSGTTGRPKGVVYTHRGAYLNAVGEIHHSRFDASTKYLWTLPMFHCNGWCTTWAVTAALGTHVCLRAVRADTMWSLIDAERIDHLNGAPTVLSTLAAAPQAHRLDHPLTITTAGAPPSPTIIAKVRDLGATLIHVYGLTETYGPYAVCEHKPEWSQFGSETESVLMARQGVGMLTSDRMRVVRKERSPEGELVDVTADGTEMGEIVMRGNSVMKGYLDDAEGTTEAFSGGWFHSGDLGVMHSDGYVQLLDRAKDVVVSGGENISTIEVEQALMSHPDVYEVAVIGVPDDKWGERPKAFVVLGPGAGVSDADLLVYVRSRLASYKAPRDIEVVIDLPKTSTGKIRKNELRDAEWSGPVRIQG